ncbi:MAG: hypothetical protein ACRC0B_01850 [Legionella sp.]
MTRNESFALLAKQLRHILQKPIHEATTNNSQSRDSVNLTV